MWKLIDRRDLLTLGAFANIGSTLAPGGSPRRVDASETPDVHPGTRRGLSVNRTLEALKEAGRWPIPAIATILSLTGEYVAARRDEEAYGYFRERAAATPDQPIF